MAEKLEDGNLWPPPAVYLGKGFFVEERRAATLMQEIEKRTGMVREIPSLSSSNVTMEMESDEEDYVAGLSQQMARSFLAEDNTSSLWDARVLGTSPQSTLCDAGIWSASSMGNTNGVSKVIPRLSTFPEQREEDAMDLLYATAGELLRKKQNEQRVHERHQLKNTLANSKASAVAGSYNNQVLARQQIQAAQFYKLKQQQLVKQQLSSAWCRQNRSAVAITNQPHRLPSSSWSPVQQQQPSSGMRAIFLNGQGARRESTGTGVFLPRRAGSPTAKKPACSTVILPARVMQALNLTLEDAGVQSGCPMHISHDHEAASARGKAGHNEQKRNIYQSSSATISGHEIRLPKEWTY